MTSRSHAPLWELLDAAQDADLTDLPTRRRQRARAVLYALVRRIDAGTRTTFVGAGTLAAMTDYGQRTVREALIDLDRLGLISRRRRHRADGSLGTYLTAVHLDELLPATVADLPAETAASPPAKTAARICPGVVLPSELPSPSRARVHNEEPVEEQAEGITAMTDEADPPDSETEGQELAEKDADHLADDVVDQLPTNLAAMVRNGSLRTEVARCANALGTARTAGALAADLPPSYGPGLARHRLDQLAGEAAEAARRKRRQAERSAGCDTCGGSGRVESGWLRSDGRDSTERCGACAISQPTPTRPPRRYVPSTHLVGNFDDHPDTF